MGAPSENESWIIESGDAVIERKARDGIDALSPMEKLIYCLWVADYGMRNAGNLNTAQDVYKDFQQDAAQIASELSLVFTHQSFSLTMQALQEEYFERFDLVCDEIKSA